MVSKTSRYNIVLEGGIIGTPAEIIRSEVMFGNIRIRCPSDLTEHEVPAGAKEFICPVGKEVLLI